MDVPVLKQPRSFKRVMLLVAPILLVAVAALASISLLGAHAAPPSGRYAFRAIVDNGPDTGVYFTGEMSMVTGTTNVNGEICGLDTSGGRCVGYAGTSSGNAIDILVNHIGQGPTLHAIGSYQTDNGKPGSFTGFTGAFTFGASTGHWAAYAGTVPSIAGTWSLYTIVQHGALTGKTTHGTLTLVQQVNNQITGTYLPDVTGATPIRVLGSNVYGYLRLYIGNVKPATVVLRGTFVNPGPPRATGRFYMPNTNNSGYWLIH